MTITVTNTKLPKLCHARIGQKIRLPDPETGDVLPEVFVLVALDDPRRRPARPNMTQGLYDEGRELRLVSLTTGAARKLPHLSSRAYLLSDEEAQEVLLATTAAVLEPESWYQVQVVTEYSALTHKVNLADELAVRALLAVLQTTKGRVQSFAPLSVVQEEELKASWRRAVAAGTTLQSFEEFKHAAA